MGVLLKNALITNTSRHIRSSAMFWEVLDPKTWFAIRSMMPLLLQLHERVSTALVTPKGLKFSPRLTHTNTPLLYALHDHEERSDGDHAFVGKAAERVLESDDACGPG
jgi:hypothetical protein